MLKKGATVRLYGFLLPSWSDLAAILGRIEALTDEHRRVLLDDLLKNAAQSLLSPFRPEVAESPDWRDPKPWLLVLAELLTVFGGSWRLRGVWGACWLCIYPVGRCMA